MATPWTLVEGAWHHAQVSQMHHVARAAIAQAQTSLMQKPPTCCLLVIKSMSKESGASVITLNQAHRFGYDSQFEKKVFTNAYEARFLGQYLRRIYLSFVPRELVNCGFYWFLLLCSCIEVY